MLGLCLLICATLSKLTLSSPKPRLYFRAGQGLKSISFIKHDANPSRLHPKTPQLGRGGAVGIFERLFKP